MFPAALLERKKTQTIRTAALKRPKNNNQKHERWRLLVGCLNVSIISTWVFIVLRVEYKEIAFAASVAKMIDLDGFLDWWFVALRALDDNAFGVGHTFGRFAATVAVQLQQLGHIQSWLLQDLDLRQK